MSLIEEALTKRVRQEESKLANKVETNISPSTKDIDSIPKKVSSNSTKSTESQSQLVKPKKPLEKQQHHLVQSRTFRKTQRKKQKAKKVFQAAYNKHSQKTSKGEKSKKNKEGFNLSIIA